MGRPTNFKLGIQMEYDDCVTDMRGELQLENSGWLFKSPLAGGGAYCGGSTAGRTACIFCNDSVNKISI